MDRKGQIAGQIFIYIVAIVVVGIIIVYGYSAIRGFAEKGEQVEYLSLKTSLENEIKGISSDFGSIKRPDLSIPGKYTHVCFVKKGISQETMAATPICGYDDETLNSDGSRMVKDIHSPVACSAWEIGRDNVFLMPDGSDSFDVGEISLKRGSTTDVNYLCYEVIGNKINMQIKGMGDRVELTTFERE